jgi:tRNA(fMet)-specific endonuclease VapC
MIILDTDHLSVLRYTNHPQYAALQARLEEAEEPLAVTVVTWEEQLRGWLAEIHRCRNFADQVGPYDRLLKLAEFLVEWEVLPFTVGAADECQRLRKEKVRIGSQDLKIAAITLTNDALLLSRNLRDFKKVPHLQVEDWIS